MTALTGATLTDVGIDAVALKPTEVAVERARGLAVDTVTIDFEGREHVPDPETLRTLAEEFEVRLTVPVRADGFDPRGNQRHRQALPSVVREVLVAGHQAYLDEDEQKRAVAPRLSAAAASADDPWIGTEGIERLALAIGGTQFELLGPGTVSSVRALREAGVSDSIAVYAPVVLSTDESTVLDSVGEYAARREPVRERLPEDAPRDSGATGDARSELLRGCRAYGLVGGPETVADRVERLRSAGVDRIVGYPARGLDPLLE
ncbi:luciferase [Halovenus sp. WSH3]|uniref:Luciferase n=1 Tax=Halovenus carboxidivorans TaxID=2692199 RepID=A0A6B0TGT8_9EURY|nr:luciferase [Halovenus carboxidivorans]MXR52409.1 luciferase [Halovenus carboxidivorans]